MKIVCDRQHGSQCRAAEFVGQVSGWRSRPSATTPKPRVGQPVSPSTPTADPPLRPDPTESWASLKLCAYGAMDPVAAGGTNATRGATEKSPAP